ncbi:MAG: FAD-binding oxidoreductase [Myxococcales bacterium 68-20]|nr:MAG: FAD-binding oxidoreductase [Myxococcales bacterium 68-20]
MSADWTDALATALGAPVQTDADILASFARDQAPLAPAGTPIALVRARSIDDVVTTLRFANERRIPVVTRAAGTGLAGGANAVDGCIVLLVSGLDRIVGIDEATRTAVVEPGVLNGVLAKEVAARGLNYAPDPASRDISTIGGNIATNAGGACCLKYGVTGDHVAALKLVLADGTVLRTGGLTKKNVAGLDLTRLVVGSEGTLGVIVEATVRLLPAPRPPSTLVAFFETLDDAARAIVTMNAGADLSLLEVMDQVTVSAVDEMTRMDLDTSAAALVLVQSDARDASATIARCEEVCHRHAAKSVLCTDDVEEGRLLLGARRMALPALERKGTTLLDDVAVPTPAIPEMLDRIRRTGERHGLVIGTFGHAGDGNLHPTIVFDRADAASASSAFEAFDEIVRDAMRLGGTISGEHGIGSLKQAYLGPMVGEAERALMARIKAAFDPNGILNPGKAL